MPAILIAYPIDCAAIILGKDIIENILYKVNIL